MSRKHREGRADTADRFVMLEHFMLRTKAWKTMPSDCKALYIEVRARYNGGNNGEISYSVREAEEIGLSRSGAARAFDILVNRGFLKVRRQSAFTLKTKEARTWEITSLPIGGNKRSADFMRWTSDGQPLHRKSKTQSHPWDAQSHPGDTTPENATILPATVPPAGLSAPETPGSQSHQRDTSNLAIGGKQKARRLKLVGGTRNAR